jgi:hypothetical protein
LLWGATLVNNFSKTVNNSRIRDPSTEELLTVLEKLLTNVAPHNKTLNPPQHPAPQLHGAPPQKRMRYDY